MNCLLDTHAFIWWNEGSSRLPARVRQALQDPRNQMWLSHASVWEMQVKSQLGKLKLTAPLADLIQEEVRLNRLRLLPIEYDAILNLDSLPQHHRDPFDRMLISQAMTGGFNLVSDDSQFAAYGFSTFW